MWQSLHLSTPTYWWAGFSPPAGLPGSWGKARGTARAAGRSGSRSRARMEDLSVVAGVAVHPVVRVGEQHSGKVAGAAVRAHARMRGRGLRRRRVVGRGREVAGRAPVRAQRLVAREAVGGEPPPEGAEVRGGPDLEVAPQAGVLPVAGRAARAVDLGREAVAPAPPELVVIGRLEPRVAGVAGAARGGAVAEVAAS